MIQINEEDLYSLMMEGGKFYFKLLCKNVPVAPQVGVTHFEWLREVEKRPVQIHFVRALKRPNYDYNMITEYACYENGITVLEGGGTLDYRRIVSEFYFATAYLYDNKEEFERDVAIWRLA